MGFLSLLKSLPASNSPAGKLSELDYQKIARLAVVVFLGAFVAQAGATTLTDANLNQVLLDAARAGLSAVGAAAVEWVRRLLASNL